MRAAFLGELAESETASVSLPEVTAAAFEAALNWMYEGKCSIDEALLPELLQLALRLQVPLLISEVESLVMARIAPNNAFGAWLLGDMHSRPALVDAAKKVALASFAEATQAEEFMQLPAAWLEELLASDELAISTEEAAFTAIQRWHAAQRPPPDNGVVRTLLSRVRWALMDREYVREHVNAHPMVVANAMILATAFQEAMFGERPRPRLGVRLSCSQPFDTNGVLYHIATAGGTRPYTNPHTSGEVVATSSAKSTWPHFTAARLVEHVHAAPVVSNATDSTAFGWMAVDLGEGRSLRPTHYCLRSGLNINRLRSWRLEGSNDGAFWSPLKTHADDTSLAETEMSVADWPIDGIEMFYRRFRVLQTGLSSSGKHFLSCAGIELYGFFRPRP